MLKVLLTFFALLVCAPAAAQEGPEVKGPVEAAGDAISEKKSEKELELEKRLAEIEAANAQKIARVVVLKWDAQSKTDYTTETLQRNIRTRILRPDAKFYPELDLYQAGRKEPDRTLRAVDQRAVVPDIAIDRIMEAVDDVSTIPWDALNAQDWGLKAYELRNLSNELWFVDRPELREPLFLLYAQIGNAAENRNDPSPPFFEQVANRPVNYYWYLAGGMAHNTPELMSKLTDQDMHASIGYYKDLLDRGDIPQMTLSFENSAVEAFDPSNFAKEYEVFINGLPTTISDREGLQSWPPGRVDVYMSRDDGHSLSDRIELDKLDDKIYGVVDTARKKMGIEFREQLMEHPNECVPEVDGDILAYLSIYAKLHGEAEIYIAIPQGGSTAANRIYLWRWDRPTGLLNRVSGDNLFPVRFAFLLGGGLDFNNATYDSPLATQKVADNAAKASPTDPAGGFNAVERSLNALPALTPAGMPIHFHLRGHYGRLLVSTGLEYNIRIGQDQWRDVYQTESGIGEAHELTTLQDFEVLLPNDGEDPATTDCSQEGAPCSLQTVQLPSPTMKQKDMQRLVFLGVGVVFGKKAALGFGPRILARTGWYNLPHSADLTGHVGYSAQAPFSKKEVGRVRPLVDLNLYGGVLIPYRDTLKLYQKTNNNSLPKKIGDPFIRFGLQGSIGTTF